MSRRHALMSSCQSRNGSNSFMDFPADLQMTFIIIAKLQQNSVTP
jgi:hypothetical protein